MAKHWFQVALFNLFVAGCMGLLLRYAFVAEIPGLHFRKFLFGHSHVAMIGWGFAALYAFLVREFIPTASGLKRYSRMFWILQILVVGMLVSFPIEGYGPFSIFFSTCFIFLTYYFAYWFWKDSRSGNTAHGVAWRFAITALIFLIISTVALWVLAGIMASGSGRSSLYYMSVQFFLHFQFNGWFTFGVLALLFRFFEREKLPFSSRDTNRLHFWLTGATLLTYALAVAWANPLEIVFWINSAGAFLQIIALIFFLKILFAFRQSALARLGRWSFALIGFALICFILKVLIQSFVIIPYLAEVAYTIRNFVIAFIHLILLGFMSHFFLGYARYSGMLDIRSRLTRSGLIVFFTGFLLSEGMLVVQGFMLWGAMGFLPAYYLLLAVVSALIPVGVGMILLGQLDRSAAVP